MLTCIRPITHFTWCILLIARASYAQGPDIVQGPPPGWELVKITDDPDQDRGVAMNNAGQIVFSKRIQPNPDGTNEEIFLYENGKLRQLTSDNLVDRFPKINDAGTIVWYRQAVDDDWEVVRYKGGVIEQITDNAVHDFQPTVGNSELIVWARQTGEDSAELFEYRDGVITQITHNGLSNQCITVNSNDDIAWVRYDFNARPSWRSTIMCLIGGEVLELTDGTTQAQGCAINDTPTRGWNDNEGIKLWQNGEITVLPNTEDDGSGPVLNNVGDTLYDFWTETHWSPFLVRDGVTYQLTDSPDLNNGGFSINDSGSIALASGDFPEIDIWLLWRVRAEGDFTGDAFVNTLDFQSMQNCMSNVECGVQMPPVCLDMFDFDIDGDIDFHDFGAFQRLVTPNP